MRLTIDVELDTALTAAVALAAARDSYEMLADSFLEGEQAYKCSYGRSRAVRRDVEPTARRSIAMHSIDPWRLALLPRDTPLRIYDTPSGFRCVINGCPQHAYTYRVRLPNGAGVACLACASDAGFTFEPLGV